MIRTIRHQQKVKKIRRVEEVVREQRDLSLSSSRVTVQWTVTDLHLPIPILSITFRWTKIANFQFPALREHFEHAPSNRIIRGSDHDLKETKSHLETRRFSSPTFLMITCQIDDRWPNNTRKSTQLLTPDAWASSSVIIMITHLRSEKYASWVCSFVYTNILARFNSQNGNTIV